MTFTAYIERQKKIIRSRHEGETFLIDKGDIIPVNEETDPVGESEKLLKRLSSIEGLKGRTKSFRRPAVL